MNRPVNASSKRAVLARIRPRAIWARTFGSRSPATSAAIMSRPDIPKMSLATTDIMISESSSSFSTRCFSAVRVVIRSTRYRVRSRSSRNAGGGTNDGRSICRSATLQSQTASNRSVLGLPGRCLTSFAFTNHVSKLFSSK